MWFSTHVAFIQDFKSIPGWTIEVLGFDSRRGQGIFLCTTVPRTALGPNQPPIQWVPWALSLGVRRPRREADHSPPSSVEFNTAWNYTSTPQYVFMTWCLVKHRDNFTFTFTVWVAIRQRRVIWGFRGGEDLSGTMPTFQRSMPLPSSGWRAMWPIANRNLQTYRSPSGSNTGIHEKKKKKSCYFEFLYDNSDANWHLYRRYNSHVCAPFLIHFMSVHLSGSNRAQSVW
jgi:hypothetical protein